MASQWWGSPHADCQPGADPNDGRNARLTRKRFEDVENDCHHPPAGSSVKNRFQAMNSLGSFAFVWCFALFFCSGFVYLGKPEFCCFGVLTRKISARYFPFEMFRLGTFACGFQLGKSSLAAPIWELFKLLCVSLEDGCDNVFMEDVGKRWPVRFHGSGENMWGCKIEENYEGVLGEHGPFMPQMVSEHFGNSDDSENQGLDVFEVFHYHALVRNRSGTHAQVRWIAWNFAKLGNLKPQKTFSEQPESVKVTRLVWRLLIWFLRLAKPGSMGEDMTTNLGDFLCNFTWCI